MNGDEEIHIDTVTFSSLRLIYIFHFDLTPGGEGHGHSGIARRGASGAARGERRPRGKAGGSGGKKKTEAARSDRNEVLRRRGGRGRGLPEKRNTRREMMKYKS